MRAREALAVVTSSIETRAGVTANLGKTRVYNRDGGPAPPGIAEPGPMSGVVTHSRRSAGSLPSAPLSGTRGLLTPTLGCSTRCGCCRSSPCCRTSSVLGFSLPCAPRRALITFCAPPPSLSVSYARGHDDAVWRCLRALLGEEDDADPEVAAARRLALLPARSGGLGLQCAVRTAPAAYWAAWADALPVLRARRPDAAARCLAELAAGPAAAAACLRAAAEAGCVLDDAGWQGRPSYITVCAPRNATCLNLARGAKVGSITVPAPALPTFARPPTLPPPAQAMLRSQSGPHAAAWPGAIPSEAGSALPPDRMLIALRRRLRLPLPVAPHRCGAHGHGCGAAVDAYGDHHATQHALEPDCSPAEQSPSSMHGCASRVRLSDPRARSSHSSGWRARQRVMLTPPIAAASTLSCTGPLRLARRCVAT